MRQAVTDRILRVSRVKYVTKRVLTFCGPEALVVQLEGNSGWWLPVRGMEGRKRWIVDRGTARNITPDAIKLLEARVECDVCLAQGQGACDARRLGASCK